MFDERYKYLVSSFLECMNDIGAYGAAKYGEKAFEARAAKGDYSRGTLANRVGPNIITGHAIVHLRDYESGELHDHFGTMEHQLAAAAFNAMMEYHYYIHEVKNGSDGKKEGDV